MVMPAAASISFLLFSAFRSFLSEWLERGLWELPVLTFAILGFLCGLFFMIGELPNSFLKRQMDIHPGKTHQNRFIKFIFLIADRIDSELAVLFFLSFLVPLSFETWIWFILLGGSVHAVFSLILKILKVKTRAL